MLISAAAAGTELSTAAAARHSRYRTPQSGARRQQTTTAVLATQTLPCATAGPQQWLVVNVITVEDPQLRSLRPAVTSTAVEQTAGLVLFAGF